MDCELRIADRGLWIVEENGAFGLSEKCQHSVSESAVTLLVLGLGVVMPTGILSYDVV